MNRRHFMKATGLTALAAAFFGKIGKALSEPKKEVNDYFNKLLRGMDHSKPCLKMPEPGKVIKWRKPRIPTPDGWEDRYLVFNKSVGDEIIWNEFKRDQDGLYKQVGTVKTDWRGLRI